jgi:hypothetical protein
VWLEHPWDGHRERRRFRDAGQHIKLERRLGAARFRRLELFFFLRDCGQLVRTDILVRRHKLVRHTVRQLVEQWCE